MRTTSELKFNPIKFALCGTNGSLGSKGENGNFFRSALSQNIVYVVWKEAKNVNEIADALGVSPVYVESEAEYLEEYGFLLQQGDKYLCNILLEEPTSELNQLQDEMYEKAAKIFANELYDDLMHSDIWENMNLQGGNAAWHQRDKNFFLWALIPYITALSGEALMDTSISFEEAATLRPDGGHNICYASVLNTETTPPKYLDSMHHWCGPCWNKVGDFTLWQIDSEWSAPRVDEAYHLKVARAITLLQREEESELSQEEYAYLVELGILKTSGTMDDKKNFVVRPACVWIEGGETKKRLIAIGDKVKEKYHDIFHALRKSYVDAVLQETPKHLHTMQKYGLQYIFHSDGWFILHCLKELVNNGKLKLPTEEQKRALTTVLIRE